MTRCTYLILLSLFLACQPISDEIYDLIIYDVNLIDGTGRPLQGPVNIFIKDGIIQKIDTEQIKGQAIIEIDGTDQYLIPGLFDGHAHPDPYYENFPRFIHYGVTSILVTGCSLCDDAHFAAMKRLGEQDTFPAPRVFHTSQHFSMEGRHPAKTYSSSNWVDGQTIFYLRDTLQIQALVAKVAQNPIAGIKLTIEEGPGPPFVERIPQEFVNKVVSEGKKNGLEVFAHISDNEEMIMAQKAGVQNLVHFTGVDIDWEEHGPVIDAFAKDSISWVTTLMIDKRFLYPLFPEWYNRPEITNYFDTSGFSKLSDPAIVQSSRDFMKLLYGVEDPDIVNIIIPQVEDIKGLYDKGINMVLGTDTGNDFIFPGFSMHEEMQLMELGGFQPIEIIKMATYNAAKMLEIEDQLGSIEEGKIADMILLSKNPLASISNTLSINFVIKNGRIQERMEVH